MTSEVEDWTRHPAAEHLLAVHALLRRDLAALRTTSADLDPDGTVDRLDASFRERCSDFCGTLSGHHYMEDAMFPRFARVEPALQPVVDRLRAQHEEVAVMISDVRGRLDAGADRAGLRHRLDELAGHLEAHLDYEEEHIGPALARLG